MLTAQRDEDWNTIKPHQMGFHSITGWVMSFQQHSYSYTQADPWTNAGHTTNEVGFHPAVMCHLLGCQGLLMTTFHDVWRFKWSMRADLTPLWFSIQSDIRVHYDRSCINVNWISIASMWWTQPSLFVLITAASMRCDVNTPVVCVCIGVEWDDLALSVSIIHRKTKSASTRRRVFGLCAPICFRAFLI